MKAGDDELWFVCLCFGRPILASWRGKHIHHNFGAASELTTYLPAMPDCSFIFEGLGLCGEWSQLEKPCGENVTIESHWTFSCVSARFAWCA